jgi:hypothetical protein
MFRWTFRSRHPLARLLAAVVGLTALIVLLTFGLLAAAAIVVGGAIVVLVKALRASYRVAPQGARPAGATASSDRVIEGEFRVTRDPEPRHQPAP